MGFPRQEYWNGVPFPTPWDLPDPGIEPISLVSQHRQADSLPLAPPAKPSSSRKEWLTWSNAAGGEAVEEWEVSI